MIWHQEGWYKMKDWKKTLVSPETPIFEAIRIIDASALQIALVIGDNSRLRGIITDGDIRRGLLKGLSLDEPVRQIMKADFTTVNEDASAEDILALMKQKELRHIPVINKEGRIVDLKILNDMILMPEYDNWVVLMAGGLGTRLQPLTDECPKPMLTVGDMPLLEIILRNFIGFGLKKFYVSVNYKAEVIEEFFGDGSRWGVEIRYIYEKQPMGTAGALSLLPEFPRTPLIVMNGDILTRVNVQQLLDFHTTHGAKATMCVRDYHFQVPYGVVRTFQHHLTAIDEKPVQRFFVNAGIYVLDPEVLSLVPRDSCFDMPDLFAKLIESQYETVAFPVREYWIDIGRMDDFKRANGEYREFIKSDD